MPLIKVSFVFCLRKRSHLLRSHLFSSTVPRVPICLSSGIEIYTSLAKCRDSCLEASKALGVEIQFCTGTASQ